MTTTANRNSFPFGRGVLAFAMALVLFHVAALDSAQAVSPRKCATAGQVFDPPRRASSGTRRCLDVELTPEGRLLGRCTGTLPEQLVLHSPDGSSVTLLCDADGNFAAEGLHGGTYQLTVGSQSWLLRTWTAGTAPPCSVRSLDLETTPLVVRGQWAPPPKLNKLARAIKYGGNNPLVVSGVLAAAVGIPVAVHNLNQDDNS